MAKSKPKLHIALFGPILPYRSGIAQYNTQLHRALSQRADLVTISFKKQYPGWLYPGKSELESGMEGYKESGVDYVIDAYNPFSLRKAADSVDINCDLAILNWWTLFWQPGFAYMSRRLRHRGIRTAFLCHNLFDHDANGLKRVVSERLVKQSDAYIVLANEQEELIKSVKPGAPTLLQLLPIYNQYPKPSRKLTKRGTLELLYFGFIRPYKGVSVLIKAMSLLRDQNIHLTIVGERWDKSEDIEKQVADLGLKNIELHLEYVNDQKAANYFERADAVVLPYISATGSAVVALAYNYGKPVIASKVGGLADSVIDGKTGWLVPPNSPEELAKAIKDTNRNQLAKMKPAIEKFCKDHSWGSLAEAICDFSQELKENK